MRLFIACELPEPTLKTAVGAVQALRSEGLSASFVRDQNLHLTLRFLGELPGSDVEVIRSWFNQSVPSYLRKCASLTMRISDYGYFKQRQGLLLWAGVEVSAGLEELVQRIEIGLKDLPLDFELVHLHSSGWLPHITLARRARPCVTQDELFKGMPRQEEAAVVRTITLFESVMEPDGVVYRSLESITLCETRS